MRSKTTFLIPCSRALCATSSPTAWAAPAPAREARTTVTPASFSINPGETNLAFQQNVAAIPYRDPNGSGLDLRATLERVFDLRPGKELTVGRAVDVATLGFIVGFTVMMALDNALG